MFHSIPHAGKTWSALAALSLLAVCAAPLGAWAWGNEGHRVTGLVANELLTVKTRIRLNQLIPNNNLGEVANEMDVYRPSLGIELPGSDKWHYDNQPICGMQPFEAYCPKGECASAKIPVFFRTIADTTATPEARAQAVRFLIHVVGDIHQPLHAADDADQGGNQKTVLLPSSQYPRRLHAAWDSDLVKIALRGISEADFAKQLIARYQPGDVATWQKGEVRDWMNESHALSQSLTYGKLPEFTCGVAWPAEKNVSLPQSYIDATQKVIPTQLAKAGARIAWLLNRALDASPDIATPVVKPAPQFVQTNQASIGAYVALIRLRSDLQAWFRTTGKLPDDAESTKAIAAHQKYWQEQLKIGRTLVGGGIKGDCGSDCGNSVAMVFFEAATPQDAETIAANDPAVRARIFDVRVQPFEVNFVSNKYSAGEAPKPQ